MHPGQHGYTPDGGQGQGAGGRGHRAGGRGHRAGGNDFLHYRLPITDYPLPNFIFFSLTAVKITNPWDSMMWV